MLVQHGVNYTNDDMMVELIKLSERHFTYRILNWDDTGRGIYFSLPERIVATIAFDDKVDWYYVVREPLWYELQQHPNKCSCLCLEDDPLLHLHSSSKTSPCDGAVA